MQQLTEQQEARYKEFKEFVAKNVAPYAEQWDREQMVPDSVLSLMAKAGYFGANVPPDLGGQGWDVVTFGLLNDAFGKESSALTGFVTVQAMVSTILLKWSTLEQKSKWLPPMAKGDTIAAFALTEPEAGSDIQSVSTELRPEGQHFVLNGHKKWISCSSKASMFLVFGKLRNQAVVCIVPREAPGVSVKPIVDLMGFRGAGLAEVLFHNVEVDPDNIVGKAGFGLSHIAPVGLQFGRISTACSALGLLRGCLEESISYAAERRIGKRAIGDIGMVRSLIARMGTSHEAASLLCYHACKAHDDNLPTAFERTLMAKYFTSQAAVWAASDAVQIRGASGCHGSSRVSRYYRDAKIMEIIEGTTQIHESILGKILVDQVQRLK
jgi:alkylation response protein AidB-like acyl-CoA dehydrogenase